MYICIYTRAQQITSMQENEMKIGNATFLFATSQGWLPQPRVLTFHTKIQCGCRVLFSPLVWEGGPKNLLQPKNLNH